MRWRHPDFLHGTASRPRRAPRLISASWLTVFFLTALLAEAVRPSAGLATNGLNLIGSGGISSALAGADTAVATDFTAMNTNPAGMVQIRRHHAGLSMGVIQPQTRFKNSLNDRDGEDDPLVIPNAGYIHHVDGTKVTVGVGFFTIGGISSDFRDLRTSLGTTDKTSSQLRHYKLTPSIAYEVTDKLSIGAALAISYSDVALAVIPNTPTGFETTDNCARANGLGPPGTCAFAFGFTPKFGLMYKLNDQITLGLAYTMKVSLPFGSGRITKNQLGIGKVNYEADVAGFKWPDDIAAGIAYRPNKDLLVSAKFQWINWDAALNTVTAVLRNGNNAAMPNDSITIRYNWRDQYVAAIGAAYDVTDRVNLHGGYNYGNNPTNMQTLDPTAALIIQHHFVGGAGYKFTNALLFDSVFTYALTEDKTYSNTTWGNNVTSYTGGYEVLFTLSYRPE